jgi:hypothetical protein
VIQGRPHLVNSLSSQNGDVIGGSTGDIICAFAGRVSDNLSRIAVSISSNGQFDAFDVFRSPDEFQAC